MLIKLIAFEIILKIYVENKHYIDHKRLDGLLYRANRLKLFDDLIATQTGYFFTSLK